MKLKKSEATVSAEAIELLGQGDSSLLSPAKRDDSRPIAIGRYGLIATLIQNATDTEVFEALPTVWPRLSADDFSLIQDKIVKGLPTGIPWADFGFIVNPRKEQSAYRVETLATLIREGKAFPFEAQIACYGDKWFRAYAIEKPTEALKQPVWSYYATPDAPSGYCHRSVHLPGRNEKLRMTAWRLITPGKGKAKA